MNWLSPVDAYCERTGPEYWSEPINAGMNLAFLIAAVVIWPRLKGRNMAMGRVLAAVLFVIGLGSWLFHTHANRLTGVADVLPILAFILLYVFAATHDYFGARPWVAALVAAGFVPYAAATGPIFAMIPGLGSSAGYAPVPVLILIYALLLRKRARHGSGACHRGRDPDRVADVPDAGSAPVQCPSLWHAFPMACS